MDRIDQSPALTVRDITASLNIARTTLYHMIKRGEFPQPIRIGKALRWEADTIEKYLKQKRRCLSEVKNRDTA